MKEPPLSIAWTTVSSRDDALQLSRSVIASGMAACCQIDGPILSVYRWQGRVEEAEEFRITIKTPTPNLVALKEHLLGIHPYETPEWVVTTVSDVSEKYLNWANQAPN